MKFCQHIVSYNPNPKSSHDLCEIWPGPRYDQIVVVAVPGEPCPRPLHISQLYQCASFYIGQGPDCDARSGSCAASSQ